MQISREYINNNNNHDSWGSKAANFTELTQIPSLCKKIQPRQCKTSLNTLQFPIGQHIDQNTRRVDDMQDIWKIKYNDGTSMNKSRSQQGIVTIDVSTQSKALKYVCCRLF